ncbi:MAG: hypothetical protein JNM84_15095 [Planctomycetes bacterium]|nr:hypothetical protein [Planctomycetota bacterium]
MSLLRCSLLLLCSWFAAGAAVAQSPAGEAERMRLLRRAVDRWAVRLASRSEEQRYEALCALIRIGLGEGDRAFAAKAVAAYEHFGALHARELRSSRVAILEMRPTLSSLQGLRPFTTSLGVGAPVTLQLPSARTTRVRSTIAVPLGR